MNIEELIFNIYKDEVIKAQSFRYKIKRKYKLSDKEISNIYANNHFIYI